MEKKRRNTVGVYRHNPERIQHAVSILKPALEGVREITNKEVQVILVKAGYNYSNSARIRLPAMKVLGYTQRVEKVEGKATKVYRI